MAGSSKGRTLKLQIVGDIGDIKKDVAEVNKTVGGLGKAAKGIGVAVAGAFAVDTVIDFAKGAIDAASDLSESMSKVGVVFGDSADEIQRWSRDSATAMGLSQQKALEAAGTFGNLFDALDLSEKATVDMSKGVVQLASDLASFNNVDPTETLQALQSGLLGEAEPMRRFGASLSEARTKAYGMEHGLGELVKTGKSFTFVMTDAQKVQARYGLILEDTKNAQGDFARTSDGLANSQRTLDANIQNVTASLGALLLGPATEFTGWVEDLIGAGGSSGQLRQFNELLEQAKENAGGLGEALAAAPPDPSQWAGTGTVFDSLLDGFNNVHEAVLDFGQTTDDWVKPVRDNLGSMLNMTEEELYRAAKSAMDAGRSFQDFKDILTTMAAGNAANAFLAGANDVVGGLMGIWDRASDATAAGVDAVEGAVADLPRFMRAKGNDAGVAFGDGIQDARDDVTEASKDLKWALDHPFDGEAERKKIMGQLMGKRLADGLRASKSDPRVRDATKTYIDAQVKRLERLKSEGYDVGVELGVALGLGLEATAGVIEYRAETKGKKSTVVKGLTKYDLTENRDPVGFKERPRSHAAGLDRVPYDGYPAILHEDEAVLNAHAADGWRAGASGSTTNVNVVINAGVGSDPVAIGRELDRYLAQYYRRTGGVRAYA